MCAPAAHDFSSGIRNMHSAQRSPRLLRRFAPVVMMAVTALVGCSDDDAIIEPARPATIVAAAQGSPDLSTLVTALTAANLTTTLSGPGPFTVFAPVNSAFNAVPADVLQRLLEAGNVEILSKVLRYHVVPGRVLAADLQEGQEVTTIEGTTLRITLAGGARVNNARITTTDIQTDNGVVHLIDGVLTESLDIVDVATIRGFSSLVSAVATAGLVDAVRGNGAGQGITVFAPTNAAFDALGALPGNPELSQVLTYHVVAGRALAASLSDNQMLTTLQGGTVRFRTNPTRLEGIGNTVNITATDIVAKNGVIHVIDAVLLPTAPVTQNIVELASTTPELSTLVTAIGAANLGGTLSGAGPFTVFAPVNSAFAAVPADVLQRLLETGNVDILSKVLRYHVVPGRVLAADLTEGQTVTTVEGTTLRITLAGGARVNDARITATDIQATNGVVHLIDGVLTESLDVVDVATIRGFSALVNAAATAGIVDALRGNGAGQGITVFAPTNAAFAALGPLPSNPTLTSVLTSHVINGRVLAAAVTNNLVAPSLQGGDLTLLTGPLRIRGVGNAAPLNITATDIVAKNGVIHVIDGIILP
jgi:transforming growth factor-beta-induced protein